MAEDSIGRPTPSRNERKAIQTEIIEANKEKIESDKGRFLSYSYSNYVKAMVKNEEKPIERKTFRSFFSSKTTPNAETTMQLCQHFLGISYPEWLKEQKKNCDNENRCEYNPIYHWTGIKSFRLEKEPVNIIQEIINQIENAPKSNPIDSQSTKEIWLYGTHFKFSLEAKEAAYQKILKNGFNLKFLISDYRKDEVMTLIAHKFKERRSTIKKNCRGCMGSIISLMQWWKDSKIDKDDDNQTKKFLKQYSHQIQVRLHGNVASSKCYIVNPGNEESISYIFPGVDRNRYNQPPVFTCKNNPGGLVKNNYFPGIQEIWSDKHTRTPSLEDIQVLDEEVRDEIDSDILNFYPHKRR